MFIREAIDRYLDAGPRVHGVGGEQIPQPEFRNFVIHAGAALAEHAGTGKPVAICLKRDWRYLGIVLACLHRGIIWVPFSRDWPDHWAKLIAGKAGIAVEVGEAGDQSRSGAPMVSSEELMRSGADSSVRGNDTINPDQCAYIRFTSGSTGQPKGVIISRRSLENHFRWIDDHFSVTPEDRMLFVSQFTFDLTILDIGLLVLRCPGFYFSDFSGDIFKLVSDIEAHRISTIVGAPNLFNLLLEDGIAERWETSLLRNVVVAGARFPFGLYRRMNTHMRGATIDNAYGPTEATNLVSSRRLSWTEEELQDKNVSVGHAVPNMTLSVLLDDGEVTEDPDQTGELLISGVQLMDRYIGETERTAEVLMRHQNKLYYRSGDLAYFDASGDCYIVGRVDDTVKVKGHRVNLLDIDSHLQGFDGIQNCATIAVEKADFDSELVTYLVAADNVEKAEIQNYLKNLVPAELIPEKFVFVESLPVNDSGKIDRRHLAETHLSDSA